MMETAGDSPGSERTRSAITMDQAKSLWMNADTVCFDVDSTVLQDEGLDELAAYCGVGQEVKDLTNQAMGGSMRFRTALKNRLDIIKPTYHKLLQFVQQHTLKLSPDVKELVGMLHERGTTVYLVTGGFQSIVEPLAKHLNIPIPNIFANRLKFYFDGTYAGFDETAPTSDSGGKRKVVRLLRDASRTMVFIGDGVTDMETCPPVDLFIGYGGNVVREKVKEGADWYITDFTELTSLLQQKES